MFSKMGTYSHFTPNHAAILLLLSKINFNGFATFGIEGAGETGAGTGAPVVDAKEV